MSAKVFELPDTMHRQWRVIESDLRAYFAALRVLSSEELEHTVSVLQPLFLKYAFQSKTFSSDEAPGSDVAQAISDWVRDLVGGLLLEVAKREIELMRAGRR